MILPTVFDEYSNWTQRISIALVALLIASLAIMQVPSASAAGGGSTIIVDADGSTGNYTSIQNAIDNATSGDTVEVRTGTYNETVNVTVSNLTIVENGTAVIDGNGTDKHIIVTARNVTLDGITVRDTDGFYAMEIAANGTTVKNVVLKNTSTGIHADEQSDITVRNLTIRNIDVVGAHFDESTNLSLSDITVENAGVRGFAITTGKNVSLANLSVTNVRDVDGYVAAEGVEIWNVTDVDATNITVKKVKNKGINVEDSDGVALSDVTVKNVSSGDLEEENVYGVYLQASRNSSISGVTVSKIDNDDIHVVGGSNFTVHDAISRSPANDSIVVQGVVGLNLSGLTSTNAGDDGVEIGNTSNVTINDVRVVDSSDDGILINQSDHITAKNVTADGRETMDDVGFDLAYSQNLSLAGLEVIDYYEGLEAYNVSDVIFKGNFTENADTGIEIGDSHNATVRKSIASSNGGDGINVENATVRIQNVTSRDNIDDGVEAASATVDIVNLTTHNNTNVGLNIQNSTDGVVRNSSFKNDTIGLSLSDVGNYTFRNNSIENATLAVSYSRGNASGYNDIDTSNTINGNQIYQFTNASDVAVNATDSPGMVIAVDSSNVTVENVTLARASPAISLWNTSSSIRNVTVINTNYAVVFQGGSGYITNSTIDGVHRGIYLYGESRDITIKDNNFTRIYEKGVVTDNEVDVATIELSSNSFRVHDLATHAVVNLNSSAILDARHNWWGAINGPGSNGAIVTDPVDGTAATGDGANVSSAVRFSEWSGAQPPAVSDTLVATGESFNITTKIRNDHNASATFNLIVKVDDSQIDTQTVTLTRGDISTNGTTYNFSTAGQHSVSINGRTTKVAVDGKSPDVVVSSDSTVTVGQTIQFDASGSSDKYGVDSITWSFGDGTSGTGANVTHVYDSTGTYNVTVAVTDNAGYVSKKNMTITVEAESTGGGGGGGGGSLTEPSASKSITDTATGATVSIRDAPIGATVTADLGNATSSKLGAVTQIQVELQFENSNFRIEVTPPSDPASKTPEFDRAQGIFQFRADSLGLPASDLHQAKIRFTVPESTLPESATPADVSLYRYHDGKWRKLKTTHEGGTTYVAITPGFSAFTVGISVQDQSTATSTPTETQTPNPTATPTSTATETTARTVTEGETAGFSAVLALLSLISTMVIVVRRG